MTSSALHRVSGRTAAGAAHPTFPPTHQRRGEAKRADARARRLRATPTVSGRTAAGAAQLIFTPALASRGVSQARECARPAPEGIEA